MPKSRTEMRQVMLPNVSVEMLFSRRLELGHPTKLRSIMILEFFGENLIAFESRLTKIYWTRTLSVSTLMSESGSFKSNSIPRIRA